MQNQLGGRLMDIVKQKYQIYPMYLDGKWIGSDYEAVTQVINPATKEGIGAIPTGGADEAEQAVDAAHKAFKDCSKKTAEER